MVAAYAPIQGRWQVPREGWFLVDVGPPEETFGGWLRRARMALTPPPGEDEVSQAELARRLGVENAGRISGYESGRYHPRPSVMRRLAEFFGEELDYLLALEEGDKRRKAYPPKPLPGPGIAVPDVPELRDLLVTLVELSDDDLQDLAEIAQGRSKKNPAAETRARRTG